MSIFIEDLVRRHERKSEDKLPNNVTIRFEGFTANFSISMNGQGEIVVYKVCKNSLDDPDEIKVKAPASNRFTIS